jgi:hypothetical protein
MPWSDGRGTTGHDTSLGRDPWKKLKQCRLCSEVATPDVGGARSPRVKSGSSRSRLAREPNQQRQQHPTRTMPNATTDQEHNSDDTGKDRRQCRLLLTAGETPPGVGSRRNRAPVSTRPPRHLCVRHFSTNPLNYWYYARWGAFRRGDLNSEIFTRPRSIAHPWVSPISGRESRRRAGSLDAALT